MPLAFESLSHGTIAFGFFNIDSDMLLLDKYFLFGSDFCEHIVAMAEGIHEKVFKFKNELAIMAFKGRLAVAGMVKLTFAPLRLGVRIIFESL